jgi:hypothetical protein
MKTKPNLITWPLLFSASFNGLAQAPPAHLSIDRQAGPVRLELHGEAGRAYSIETAPGVFSSNRWTSVLTLSLTNDAQSWWDATSLRAPQRFYRAVTLDGPPLTEVAQNFRLIDHQGKSRELNYHWTDTNVAAFVLIFTANGCAEVRALAPAINALQSQFAPQQVRFWMIGSDPARSRSNIVAEAAALGLTLPILHDRDQLVARAYRVATAPEAVGVGRGEFPGQWTIFYRGAMEDRVGSNAVATTQNYLADALANFLASQTVTPSRTRPEGCPISLVPVRPVSYANDIAPLLQNKCVRCHSPGNIAPWAMTNHAIVQTYGLAMKEEVMAGRMPPWHADPEYGAFTNDFSLSAEQARQLIQWIDDGAPRGDGPDPLADSTPTLEYPHAWPTELGEPDAILTFPVQSIKATGIEPYRTPTMTSPFPSNVWLRAAVVLPSNPGVAHHEMANLSGGGNDNLGGYNPGQPPWIYPPGTGRMLPRGAVIELSLHYVTSGTPQTDQPRIGLYLLRDKPPLVIQSLGIGWASEGAGVYPAIRPFVQEDVRTATYSVSRDMYLFQMHPHMHLRGAWMTYEALYPGGAREILLSTPQFHAHWQTIYRFTQPKRLPAGTTIKVTGAFDNSPQNPHNTSPQTTVNWGQQLEDEMFLGYIHFAATLTIHTQPRSQNVARGGSVTFAVSATTPNPPLRYQWQFDGEAIAGATNASFTIPNAQSNHEGVYSVVVSDQAEAVTSRSATLTVGDRPAITEQPQSQTVYVGDTVSFTVSATGALPLSYRWRKDSLTVTNLTLNATTAALTLTNVQANHAGNYTVVVTNLFGAAPVSSNAVLTVLSP